MLNKSFKMSRVFIIFQQKAGNIAAFLREQKYNYQANCLTASQQFQWGPPTTTTGSVRQQDIIKFCSKLTLAMSFQSHLAAVGQMKTVLQFAKPTTKL